MSPSLVQQSVRLADSGTTADLRTFVTRARTADDGGIRLQASGQVLAATVAVMRPRLLGEGTPTILGMRAMALASSSDLDVTVPLAAVADRLARMDADGLDLQIPPMTLNEPWAGISAPRGGWERLQEVDAAPLLVAAKDGVREIGQIVPASPGALIVNNARATVWGRTLPVLTAGVPAGAAFAAYALGFLVPGETVRLFRSQRWLRLSTDRGHVLVKPAAFL